jgi:hypothetical protein
MIRKAPFENEFTLAPIEMAALVGEHLDLVLF